MKPIADTLGVARSNLVARTKQPVRNRGSYVKSEDERLLPEIRQIIDARPTYGYRRVTALLNRRLQQCGAARVNHKRVLRIMRRNSMLLRRHTGRTGQRAHDGVVQTLRSNQRWCADGFDIPCWNGETVRVAFSLDTCDREAIAWTASTAGISGEMVRDIMLLSLERRFKSYRAPHRIEWLADNGSGFTAVETIDFALAVGLRPCFTPVRSPESNGMAEAFVKSFKRRLRSLQPVPRRSIRAATTPWLVRRLQYKSPTPRPQDALAARVHPGQFITRRVSGFIGATPPAA